MKDHHTAVLKQKGDWWIGWIGEVPGVNCQERSQDEIIETLRITLREALEFNRREGYRGARMAGPSPSDSHNIPR